MGLSENSAFRGTYLPRVAETVSQDPEVSQLVLGRRSPEAKVGRGVGTRCPREAMRNGPFPRPRRSLAWEMETWAYPKHLVLLWSLAPSCGL